MAESLDGKRVVPINVGDTSRNVVVSSSRTRSLTSRVADACKEVIGPGRLVVDKRWTYKWIKE